MRAGRRRVVRTADGLGLCNALYVDDAVGSIVAALQAPFDPKHHTFLISAEAPCTWRAFYEEHARAGEVPAEIDSMPLEQLRRFVTPGPITAALRAVWAYRSEARLIRRVPGGQQVADAIRRV